MVGGGWRQHDWLLCRAFTVGQICDRTAAFKVQGYYQGCGTLGLASCNANVCQQQRCQRPHVALLP